MPQMYLVVLPVIVLLAGAALQLVLARVLSSRGKGWLAFLCSLIALGGVLALYPIALQGQAIDLRVLSWDGPAALAYHVDGLSLLFALMAAGIGAAVLLYSVSYMAHDASATRFYALMLVFIAGFIHLVYSADLLLLYLSWEIIGLCSFLLVGFWYQQAEAAVGARKVLVMTHIAGYGLLAAILLLYANTGSTLWTDPKVAQAFSTGIFGLMLIAAIAKSVQFPLHTWIPDAMAAPTPVSALLHAACYVKAGVYLIARLHSFGDWSPAWQTTVVWIGTITMLVGVLYAAIQSDLKRLLAFHTVSQIGYMLLGLGLGTPLGIAAGLLHCLNHGLFKGGLFLCAGAVQHATGTRDMDRMGGLARFMPRTAMLWLICAGSIAGVPLLSGFVSKWLLFNAALEVGQVIPALISWIVSVLTMYSFLKATSGVFLGEPVPQTNPIKEAPLPMLVGIGFLSACSLLIGVAPQFAINYLINPLLPALGMSPVIQVSWLGLTTGSGSWFATGGVALMLIAVSVGGLVYWFARPARQVVTAGAGGGVFTGGEPLSGMGRLSASDFSIVIKQGLAPFYHWVDVDRYYLDVWRAMLSVSAVLSELSAWLERRAMIVLPVGSVALLFIAFIAGGATSANLAPAADHAPSELLLIGTGIALAALVMTALSFSQTRSVSVWLIVAGGMAMLGLAQENEWLRLALLEGGTIFALLLVWQTAQSRRVFRFYLVAVLLSIGGTVSGTLLLDTAPQIAFALLLTGFAIKLALVPLYLWLPSVAESVPAVVVGLVVAVVDVAAFGELLLLRQSAPGLFAPSTIWLALALLSTLGGVVLMLAQRDLKRLLAFSTIEDMGYLLLGVTVGGELGMTGAMIGIIVHALAKALLFASLSAVEVDETPTLDSRGLASRYPVSAAGFLIGALAMLGVPPTLGYIARWRLYSIAAEQNPIVLGVLMIATALAVLAYARVITVCWWGSGSEIRRREPIGLIIALVGLSVLLVLFGLVPGLVIR